MTLPRGWAQAPIGSLCTLINGRAFKPSEWSTSGLKIIRIQNLNRENAEFNHFAGRVEDKHVVESGDLLFAWSGTPGTSFGAHIWRGQQAVLNQHIFKVNFRKDLFHHEFFRRAINVKLEELIDKAHGGAGLAHVTKGRFEETRVEIPPPAEQRRIVAKLDGLTARTNRAREELARSHKLVASLKREALATADNGDRTGRITGWLAAPIRNGLSVKGSDVPPGVRALRLSALRADIVNFDAVRYLPISFERAQPFLLKADDILVSRGNGTLSLVGRASRVPSSLNTTSTIFPDTAFRLRFDPAQVDVTWLLHVWNSPLVRQQIEARARTTAGIWKISQVDLSEITLPKLSLAEQRAAASRISAILTRADHLEAEAARAAALLERLEASILAKAFRGELVPQDPADEPASSLLDRIRAERAAAPKVRRGRGATEQAEAR